MLQDGITHQSFVEDLLQFARGDLPSVTALYKCFLKFSHAFGLQEIMSKNFVYFGGVTSTERNKILQPLGIEIEDLPFKYLKILLSTKKTTLVLWRLLILKIIMRISSWTVKKLSYASRIQLVQTMIFGIQAYQAQLYILPTIILKVIDAYCKSYVWSGTNEVTKKTLVAWEKLCSHMACGGLNLKNLTLWNKVTIATNCWDLTNKKDRLWISWVHSYYVKNKCVLTMVIPKQASEMVKQIIGTRRILQDSQ
ncbi:hypothetical protein MTR67_040182 [Solanum verrucosum]|uniref:Uncharacterized protein n=1 Tax=Solanum verrucosum TaxID=315347 RepID=A0AAF0UIU0_SOLVR|nr:hypothetical protein MTR67_040182 [Solanum verrucosum]